MSVIHAGLVVGEPVRRLSPYISDGSSAPIFGKTGYKEGLYQKGNATTFGIDLVDYYIVISLGIHAEVCSDGSGINVESLVARHADHTLIDYVGAPFVYGSRLRDAAGCHGRRKHYKDSTSIHLTTQKYIRT